MGLGVEIGYETKGRIITLVPQPSTSMRFSNIARSRLKATAKQLELSEITVLELSITHYLGTLQRQARGDAVTIYGTLLEEPDEQPDRPTKSHKRLRHAS